MSFKKETDDIREAASLRLIEKLKRKGAQVVAYDPMAMPNAKRVLANTVEFARAPDEALKGADTCILMTEWDEFRKIEPKNYLALMRTPNLVDARRPYNPRQYQELAFAVIGLGPASCMTIRSPLIQGPYRSACSAPKDDEQNRRATICRPRMSGPDCFERLVANQ